MGHTGTGGLETAPAEPVPSPVALPLAALAIPATAAPAEPVLRPEDACGSPSPARPRPGPRPLDIAASAGPVGAADQSGANGRPNSRSEPGTREGERC